MTVSRVCGGDKRPIGEQVGSDRLLDQPGEAVSDALGGATIEAEHVLVEISREMLLADGAVMGAEKPALGESEDEMDGRQAQHSVAPGGAESDGLVAVSLG